MYLTLYALSGMNLGFISTVPIIQSGRELTFRGNIVEQVVVQDNYRVAINLTNLLISKSGRHFCLPVEMFCGKDERLLGKEVIVKGRVSQAFKNRNKYRFAGEIVSVCDDRSNVLSLIDKSRAYIEDTFKRIFHSSRHQNICLAMILGGTNRLAGSDQTVFRDAGVMHIMVVSGLHVGFVVLFVGAMFFIIPMNRYIKFLLIAIALFFYASLTGWRPSVFRATLMTIIFSMAVVSERNIKTLHVVNVTALIFLIIDPLIIFDLGAQLSFAAVYGIVILYPQFKVHFVNRLTNRIYRMLLTTFFVSLSAQLFLIPLLSHYFHRITPYGLVSNVIIVPLASLIIFLLFTILITGTVWTGASWMIALIVRPLLFLLTKISYLFSSLPGAGISFSITPLAIPFIYLMFFKRFRKIGLLATILLLILKSIPAPASLILVQNHAAGCLITLNNCLKILIDQSTNNRELSYFLQSQNLDRVDYVVSKEKNRVKIKSANFICMPSDFVAKSIKYGQTSIEIDKKIVIFHGKHRFEIKAPERGVKEYVIANNNKMQTYRSSSHASIIECIVDDTVLLALRLKMIFQL